MKRQFKDRITLLDCEYWNKCTRPVFMHIMQNRAFYIFLQDFLYTTKWNVTNSCLVDFIFLSYKHTHNYAN